VTLNTIKSLGFKSTNDRALLPILKGLGFVDGSGGPTERRATFRSNHKVALADGIREHYAKLFLLYPDAYQKDNEALHSFFSSNTSVGEGALKYVIGTFRTLCSLAAFDQPSVASPIPATPALGTPAAIVHTQPVLTSGPGWTVNINVQLTLPENADSKTFDDFFKAMKKNLLDEK
jgi:hypothetical protein